MRIAVEGCAHGELETIYSIIQEREKNENKKVDLLLCCGDFQAVRNLKDLQCMAVPDKYKDMGTFYKYYSGEKVAPVLTIFIGGNHEASNYLQELPYGGWVAPNIYYLGYAGVVTVAGIRIAGFSGIYKKYNYMKGHYEFPPYNKESIRSVYHIRNLEIFRLKQLSGKIDIFMSHDWPVGVTEYGDVEDLLRKKSHFREDIKHNCLGSAPAMELLKHHYPSHWFAAHLHCKFIATVPKESETGRETKFLALDKCLQRRQFLEILDVEHDEKLPITISYDLEWLTVLFLTNHLLSIKSGLCYMPGPVHQDRYKFTPSDQEKERINQRFGNDLTVPLSFRKTVEPFNPRINNRRTGQPNLVLNHQTTEFCDKLSIDDPFSLLKQVYNIRDESENTIKDNETLFSSSTPSIQTSSSFSDFSCPTGDEGLGFVIDKNPTPIPMLLKTPLKLPTVKNDGTDGSTLSQNELNTSESISKECLLEENAVNVASPTKSSTFKSDSTIFQNVSNCSPQNHLSLNKRPKSQEDDELTKSTTNVGEVTSQQSFKQFKRRNQSIYADEESST